MVTKSPSKPTKNPPRTVGTIAELAAFCGVSRDTIKKWKAIDGFPVEEDGYWSPFRVGQWHAIRESRVESSEQSDDDEDETPDGYWAEEFRKEKTLIARMDRRERERGLLDRERTHSFMLRVAGLLRTATDTLQRMFGERAHKILSDCVNDMEAETEREFRDDPEIELAEEIEPLRN